MMLGVEVKPNFAPEKGWAEDAGGLILLMQQHPIEFAILVVIMCLVLLLLPGGMGPGWVKYRGANRELEQKRTADVQHTVALLGKRAQRRQRGREKGGRK